MSRSWSPHAATSFSASLVARVVSVVALVGGGLGLSAAAAAAAPVAARSAPLARTGQRPGHRTVPSQPATKRRSTIAVSVNPPSTSVGRSVRLSAAVHSSGSTPTGTVTFSDAAGKLCSGRLSRGTAHCNAAFKSAAALLITAKYSGDSTHLAATGHAHLTVSRDATSTSVSVDPSTIGVGGSVTLSATVSSSYGTPAGTVTFTDGSTTLCGATLSAGVAQCTGSEPAACTYTVTGTYSGDAAHAGSSGTATLTVNQDGSQLAISVSPTTVDAGQSTTFSATVTAASGTPTGTVAFSDSGSTGSGALCIAHLSGGTGQCTSSVSVPDVYTVDATYSGDQSFEQSSATATWAVVKNTTTVTASVNPATITVGGSTTLSATVTAPYGTPTGTVTFEDSQSDFCTATLSGGTASCTASMSGVGTYDIAAAYSGDGADYQSGTSTDAVLVVNPVATTTTIAASPNPILNEGTVTLSATVTAASGPAPSGYVSFISGAYPEICEAVITNGHGTCTGPIHGNGTTSISGTFDSGNVSPASSKGTTTVNVTPSTSDIYACMTIGNNDKEMQTPVEITITSSSGTLYSGTVSQNQYWNDGVTNCTAGGEYGQYWVLTLSKTVATSSLAGATFQVYAPGNSWHGQFEAWAYDNSSGLEQVLETVPNMYYNDNGNLDPCSQYIGLDESAYTFTFQAPGSAMVQTCGVAG